MFACALGMNNCNYVSCASLCEMSRLIRPRISSIFASLCLRFFGQDMKVQSKCKHPLHKQIFVSWGFTISFIIFSTTLESLFCFFKIVLISISSSLAPSYTYLGTSLSIFILSPFLVCTHASLTSSYESDGGFQGDACNLVSLGISLIRENEDFVHSLPYSQSASFDDLMDHEMFR